MTHPALRTLDAFLPADLRQDPRSRRRGRVLVATSWGLAVLTVTALALRRLLSEIHPAALWIAGIGIALFAAAPWFLKLGASLAAVSQVVILTGAAVAAGSGFYGGGVESPVYVILPILPLIATFLHGVRSGVVMAGVLVAVVLALTVLVHFGLALPEIPFEGLAAVRARALMITVAMAIAILFGAFYENQRLEGEERLRESEALYRKIFEQSKDVVALTSPGGRLIDINPAGLELYGYRSVEEMRAADLRSIYVDPKERKDLLAQLAKLGFVRHHEHRHRIRSGEIRVIQGTTSTLRGEDGEPEMLLAILRDVTDERRAAAEREAVLAELAAKNDDLERFTYTVSHDLKSPLITARGFLDLARRDVAAGRGERLEESFAHIDDAVSGMGRLIEDLLMLSRVPRKPESFIPVALGEVAREIRELLAGSVRERGAEVVIAPDLPEVWGDPTLLRLIYQNLIDNALKFTAGVTSPRIEVGWRPGGEGPGQEAPQLYVADNGAGVPEASKERIFGLFEKLDVAGGAGTGIGLATVKRAVEAHGGRVWVESPGEGQGSTFCFTLATA